MAAAPFEKQRTDLAKKPPEGAKEKATVRVKRLTFWQKALLTAGIITIGGVPGALMTMGSVRSPPPQAYSSNGPAVISNTTPIQVEACTIPAPEDDFKPTMNSQNR